jgi:hypothetical protein
LRREVGRREVGRREREREMYSRQQCLTKIRGETRSGS